MNISIGNDHAGTNFKFNIIEHLENKKINIESSIIVVGVFASVSIVAIQITFSNFLSFK